MLKSKFILIITSIVISFSIFSSEPEVIILNGNNYQMGQTYGKRMAQKMRLTLDILKKYYVKEKKITYQAMIIQGDSLFQKIPYQYQVLLKGVSDGSKLDLSDIKILNAMETMGGLSKNIYDNSPSCAFAYIPPNKSKTNSTIIGRNYDFFPPFEKVAPYITVTVFLGAGDTIPTAIISLPGQLYCPTGINAKGLFLELNNGSPSGGGGTADDKQSLLSHLLYSLQNSSSLSQLGKMLNSIRSDYSLIVNISDDSSMKSFEYSSTQGMQKLDPPKNQYYVSTNYYLSENWTNIPYPTDDNAWFGVTRRNNFLHLLLNNATIDVEKLKNIMDKDITNGGAKWKLTLYQIIFDSKNMDLYIKVPKDNSSWNMIPLSEHFSR